MTQIGAISKNQACNKIIQANNKRMPNCKIELKVTEPTSKLLRLAFRKEIQNKTIAKAPVMAKEIGRPTAFKEPLISLAAIIL